MSVAAAPRRILTRREGIPPAGLLQLLGSVVLFGGAWPFTKYAVQQGAAPLWFAEGRAGLSCVSAFLLLAALRRLRLPVRPDLPALLGVGLLQIGAFFAFVHAAVGWLPAGRTAVLANVTSIFVVPLSVIVLHESISALRWIATAISLAGVIVLIGPWGIDWSQPGVLIGHAFLLSAGASWGVTIILVRRFPPHSSMLELLPWCLALASLMLLPILLAEAPQPGNWTPGALAAVGFVGLLAGPVGTWCVMQAAVTLPALVASIGFLMTPAAGLLLATVWLGEPLTLSLALGSALILAGVVVAAWPPREA
ncbi:MAG: DMT family transporter [Acidisphaera sp.]|nr:DMT family transporter [Acidisphaera sp.]